MAEKKEFDYRFAVNMSNEYIWATCTECYNQKCVDNERQSALDLMKWTHDHACQRV